MKKTLFVILPLALCLLCACGGQEAKEPAPFDPAADAETLLNTEGVFTSDLTEIDQATACALYGIDEGTVDSCKVYMGNTGVSLEELAIFALKDEAGASAAQTSLGYRLEDQKEAAARYADYLKDELSKLEGARVELRGNTVLLIVAADYSPVEDFLKGD